MIHSQSLIYSDLFSSWSGWLHIMMAAGLYFHSVTYQICFKLTCVYTICGMVIHEIVSDLQELKLFANVDQPPLLWCACSFG